MELEISLRPKLNHLGKIRVGAVSYLNTKPLLFGIKNSAVMEEIELVEDYPANIAGMLARNEIDLGLVPVAATLQLKEWHLASGYGIASEGPVASVCIFSEQPIEEIDTVYLDYQSRTSVNLARILLREYWKREVKYIDASGEDFRDRIKGKTAAVVIGDRALEQRAKSSYIYDLATAWKEHTGLPFVFAGWISNKKLDEGFIKRFDEANAQGLIQIDFVIKELNFSAYPLEEYFKRDILYKLSPEALKGMDLFLRKLNG